MDSLCLKAGVPGITSPLTVADIRTTPSHVAAAVGRHSAAASNTISVEKQSISAAPSQRTEPWGFSFKYPIRSLWPGGRNRRDAIAVDDAVLVEEKEEKKEPSYVGGDDGKNGNWVLKILHLRSMWKDEDRNGVAEMGEEEEVENDEDQSMDCQGSNGDDDEECDVCRVDDDDKIEFDRDSFSKLLRKVSLNEARSYAQMSYLGNLAYTIADMKPKNLLRNYRLRFITSSLEKKNQALKEKTSTEVQETEVKPEEIKEEKTNGSRINASAAYRIAAAAASYLHSHTKSILPFKNSGDDSTEGIQNDANNLTNEELASLMATTDSVTAVVAAEEKVKQAVADDLNSTSSTPCDWFICDDDRTGTRFFVIQGSESLASWKANLLFEPIEFEGMDVLVHRGIYEAAKGIYEQMLPEVRTHLNLHGERATFRFTGHSLGGSLSMLVNLMLIIRHEVPISSLLPVVTFGAPSIMCGGDRLLRKLGLPRRHVQSISLHRDIVPRAFSCNYPSHVAEFLKAVNQNFRNHPCLKNKNLLYDPMGEFLILQPNEKLSPNHHLLPSGSGLYVLSCPVSDPREAEKQTKAAVSVFLNSPHPLEILSDRSAYGSEGTIQRDHDMHSYLKSVRSVIRQELSHIRKARRVHRQKVWWSLVTTHSVNAGLVVGKRVQSGIGKGEVYFSGFLNTGKESLKRFSRLVASQHMHLLVVLLFPARLLIVGTYGLFGFR